MLADVSDEVGRQAIGQIEREFGPRKSIFVKADVTDYNQFESMKIFH